MYLLKSFTPLVPWSKHFFWACCFHKECQNLNSFTYNESILCPLLPHGKVAPATDTPVLCLWRAARQHLPLAFTGLSTACSLKPYPPPGMMSGIMSWFNSSLRCCCLIRGKISKCRKMFCSNLNDYCLFFFFAHEKSLLQTDSNEMLFF